MKRHLLIFLIGFLMVPGCKTPSQRPVVRAPSIAEEVDTLEIAGPVFRDATGRIRKATADGRVEAPELSEWEKIEDAAYDIEAATVDVEKTAASLSNDSEKLLQYESYVAEQSKEKQVLAAQIKKLRKDQTRSSLAMISAAGAAMIVIGALLFWVDKRWGVIVVVTGAGVLLVARAIAKFLAVFDVILIVVLAILPIALVGYLVWRYRKRLAQLIRSVQKAKGSMEPEALEKFRVVLAAEQDNSLQKEINKVKKGLTKRGEIVATRTVTPAVSTP